MFERDNWIEIWATIRSNRLRSILTAFGVFWGIFILVFMLGSSNGFENGLKEKFDGLATNTAFMWSQSSSIPYKGYNAGRRWDITNFDIEGIKSSMPNIKAIAPRLSGHSGVGDNVIFGDMKGKYSVFGDYPDFFNIVPVKILKGRLINSKDIADERKVCVIGERIANEIFKETNPINKYLKVDNIFFKVVGVIHPRTDISLGSDPKNTVFLPFTTLQKNYGYGNEVHYFGITVKDGIKVSVIEEKIRKYLLKQHDLSPDDKKALGGFNMQETFEMINGMFLGIDILSWIVGLGTLLAGIIGVSNIMLIAIKERTKEIGIKRALGAQSKLIRSQILFESSLITVFAGFFGLFISVAFIELVGSISGPLTVDSPIHFVPTVNLQIALAALLVLTIGGVLAGLFPASRAINIKPIEALRDE